VTTPITHEEAIQGFIKRLRELHYAPTTIYRMRGLLRIMGIFYKEHPELPKELSAYKSMNKKNWADTFIGFLVGDHPEKKAYQNSTVAKTIDSLNTVMNHYDINWIIELKKALPSKTFVRGNEEPYYFTDGEVQALIEYSKTPNLKYEHRHILDQVIFCCYTGLRFGELIYVTADRIQLRLYPDGTPFYVLQRYSPKEKNSNVVPLNTVCMEIVTRNKIIDHDIKHGMQEGCVFPVVANINANKILTRIMKTIGGPFNEKVRKMKFIGTQAVSEELYRWQVLHWHSSRHYYAYMLRNIGVGIQDASVLMNHKSTAMLQKHYKHINKENVAQNISKLLN
jgi:integrase